MDRYILLSMTAIGLASLAGSAIGQETGEHKVISPQDIKWGPAPPSVPPGAQSAVLYGDPGKEGLFAFRLKVPKGYHIAPHTHPKPEIVTVLSGTARLGNDGRSRQGSGSSRGQLLCAVPQFGALFLR
jgi:hypothetical protein